ncbi:Protein BRANCHLESS TRICHOME [Cardamine amara subsp. amara]|uniref:Protein BRANCHLESS TRICHOME n=1 Tax=Cardamine amara subsp. amara TaxID=228776 RepID=A0ABD0ZGP8_CARAN
MKTQRSHETMMTRISTPDPHNTNLGEDIMDSVCKTWKLYDNPYYCSSQSQQQRKAFIWDLNFIRVFMESQLDKSRAEIKELKAELDYERKARRRAELMNKRLAKDVEEERIGREAEQMQYKRLLKEISSENSEIKRELEEERHMHRLAEVLREERVQMKLTDARIFLEEKLSELEESNRQGEKERTRMMKPKILERACSTPATRSWENPHIKRGIKGFVEFPRVMRAIRSKSEQWGSKLECQKVQLKILLRQKTIPRCSTLLSSD